MDTGRLLADGLWAGLLLLPFVLICSVVARRSGSGAAWLTGVVLLGFLQLLVRAVMWKPTPFSVSGPFEGWTHEETILLLVNGIWWLYLFRVALEGPEEDVPDVIPSPTDPIVPG